MRKILFFIYLLSFVAYGQESTYQYKISYTYRFMPIPNDTNRRVVEEMLLLVGKNNVYFVSANKFAMDTIMAKTNGSMEGFAMASQSPRPRVGFEVLKNKEKNEYAYYETFYMKGYRVSYKPAFNWNLGSETKKVGKYICKQAKTSFAGRNYIAWYTEDIALSEGPYKFEGLPGLILEIYDDKNEHHFSANSIQKITISWDRNTNINSNIPATELKSMAELEKARANTSAGEANDMGFKITVDVPQYQKKMRDYYKKKRNSIEIVND